MNFGLIFLALFCALFNDASDLQSAIETARQHCVQASFEPSAVTRADYLKIAAATHLKNRVQHLDEQEIWTNLLRQLPNGASPNGGNEAIQCFNYESWAARNFKANQTTEAGIFKRAAHLAFESTVAQSHETWTEAWKIADDAIPETATPCEVGGFVFTDPLTSRIIANAGGFRVELDGSEIFALHAHNSDSLIGKTQFTTGLLWPVNDSWRSLQDASKAMRIDFLETVPDRVAFSLKFSTVEGTITAQYNLTPKSLRITFSVLFDVSHVRIRIPPLRKAFATIDSPEGVISRDNADGTSEADVIGRAVTFTIVPQ